MAKKKEEFVKQDEQLEEVNEALTGAGKWIEDNANLISWIVCGIAVVVMGIIAINQYVIKPKALEASNENAKAVAYFERERQGCGLFHGGRFRQGAERRRR